MFVFVCPIRHPASSHNYNDVLFYLRKTVESLSNQKTSRPYKIIVVCNQAPNEPELYPNTSFVEVDFAPPDANKGSGVPFDLVKEDKGCKVSVGLLYAKQFAPDYVFVIDGDDWFNVATVDYIYQSEPNDLYYANSGFVVNLANNTYLKKYGICRYCGSAYIYKYSALMELSGLSGMEYHDNLQKADFFAVVDEFFLKHIIGNHRHQIYAFSNNNYAVTELKIPVVAWILNTGENHSAQNPGNDGLQLSKEFLGTFGISSIEPSIKTNAPITWVKAKIKSLQSYLGWIKTDKSKEKV
jgi:hypothetical protein